MVHLNQKRLFVYLANKVCFCLLNDRGEFDSLVDALGVHLEGAQGDAGLAAHSVRAPVRKKIKGFICFV
jgi:hypothetical protein